MIKLLKYSKFNNFDHQIVLKQGVKNLIKKINFNKIIKKNLKISFQRNS